MPDEVGRLEPFTVDRFHDAYAAGGVNLEFGVVELPWAERLSLRLFHTDFDKESQHNVVMTVPYGEDEFGGRTTGGTLRFERAFGERVAIDLVAEHSRSRNDFLDAGECVHDWFGNCIRERVQGDEIESRPRDQIRDEIATFARLSGIWQLAPRQSLQLSVSPTFTDVSGDERRQFDENQRDPLEDQRELLTAVAGVEHTWQSRAERVETIAFVKHYHQDVEADETLAGGTQRIRDRDSDDTGFGGSLRYRLAEGLFLESSYEFATGLPRPDELFGDGVLIRANLELQPETSHNVNLGVGVDRPFGSGARWRADVNSFLREADQLIVLLGNDREQSYQNVFEARSLGLELAGGWTSPGARYEIDANATWQEFTNESGDGAFGAFEGDRIPNRPYAFANLSARYRSFDPLSLPGELTLALNSRYVDEFFRGWESAGLRAFKQSVDSQLSHSLAATFLFERGRAFYTLTAEVQNLTDEKVFDFFGVQKPGRGFFLKATAEF